MLVYVSLAVGLVVGKCVVTGFGVADPSLVLYSLCGAAITMLVATVLTPFREQESFETQMARLTSEAAESGVAATGGAAGSEAGAAAAPASGQNHRQHTILFHKKTSLSFRRLLFSAF